MKSAVKTGLRCLGNIPGFRSGWLTMARWVLANVVLPQRIQNMIVWELSTYILGEAYETEVRLETGPVIVTGLDDLVNRLILFYPGKKDYIWEPQTLRLAMRLQEPDGMTVIAGGHIGYHAVHLAQAAQLKKGSVVVFEPTSKFHQRLVRSAAHVPAGSIVVERAALDVKSQPRVKIYLAEAQSSLNPLVANKAKHWEEVRSWSLDDFAVERNLHRINLVFLDVEGHELTILKGAVSILEQEPDLILEANVRDLGRQGKTVAELLQFLFERGYAVFVIDDAYEFTLTDHRHKPIRLKKVNNLAEQMPFPGEWFNIFATRHIARLEAEGSLVVAE